MNEAGKLVIIGGGPAGLAAARSYRAEGGSGQVEILTTEDFPPYRRPPLTKEYLRGEIPRQDLPMEEPDWYEKNDVRLRLSTPVRAVDVERRIVETGTGEVGYDALVLATGSEPFRLPVPGGNDPEIMVIRTVQDSTRVQQSIVAGGRATVVGSGFIGCEAAASLAMRSAEVTLVSMENLPQEQRLGEDVGNQILSWLESYGVELRLGVSVEEIERSASDFSVTLGGGKRVTSGALLFGTGVRPRTRLAKDAGIEMEAGGIVVDSSMRTSAPGIFAVGDIAYAMNTVAGRRLRVEHWGDALIQGQVAGKTIAGGESSWDSVPGFWSTIGDKRIKYAAWGDGWDESRFVDHDEGAFTIWYGKEDRCVGVLTHLADEDYEAGRGLIETGSPLPV